MPREQNYLTVDKECQAIKRELEALKHTLIGQRHLHLFSERGFRKPDNPSAFLQMPVRFTVISTVPLLESKCLYLSTAAAAQAM